MKGKVQLIFVAVVAYLLGCVFRHKRCQGEWRDRHPYSYTGKEIISSMKPRYPDLDIFKTTPVLRKPTQPTQPVEKEDPIPKETSGASVSIRDYSLPEKDPAQSPERKSPVHKKSDPTFEKTTNTIPAFPKISKPSRPTKTTTTTAPKVTKIDSKSEKNLITPFPDDPPAGFNAFGIEWRRDKGPGKMFAGFTDQFKKETTTATTTVSVPTSINEPETSPEVEIPTRWWSRVFGNSAISETTQPAAVVSIFTSDSETLSEVDAPTSWWSRVVFGTNSISESTPPAAAIPILTRESETSSEVKSPRSRSRKFGSHETTETRHPTASVSISSEPDKSFKVKSSSWWSWNSGSSETSQTTQPTASVSVPATEPAISPDIAEPSNWLPWPFWAKGKAEPTQSLASVSTSTTTSVTEELEPKEVIQSAISLLQSKTAKITGSPLEPKDIIQSATSLLKSKTARTTDSPLSGSNVDQSSVGFFGRIIDWMTGKVDPTEDSNQRPVPRGCGFAGGSITTSLTHPKAVAEPTAPNRWYNYFQRITDSKQSTTSSTVTPEDRQETTAKESIQKASSDKKSKSKSKFTKPSFEPKPTDKLKESGPTPRAKTDSIVKTKISSKSNSSTDRKAVTGLYPSTKHQQVKERNPTVEARPTKERKSFEKPKQEPLQDVEDNVGKRRTTKRSKTSEWFFGTWTFTTTIHIPVPWPTFGIRPDANPPTLVQDSNQE